MPFLPIVSKARKISDLNNVPLVSGGSLVKWYLPHSIHGEHRGRTQKRPILNHRVEYHYSKIISVRIAIDRNSNLSECPIEFEVLQEFSNGNASANGRDEKITLGTVRLNLSEYVEESEAILRNSNTAAAIKEALASPVRIERSGHRRRRSSQSNTVPEGLDSSPRSSHASEVDEERPPTDVQEGVVRRYLMQDSKINSTLKISILMVQVDGERNYIAPPPKSAPVFGGIAGFVAGDVFEPVDAGPNTPGHAPSSFSGKSRDLFELQDMYRRALAASWASQPGELPADQCIEDIFAGGEGFVTPTKSHARGHSRHHSTVVGHGRGGPVGGTSTGARHNSQRDDSGYTSDNEENGDVMGTLRPRDVARLRRHLREHSIMSDRTVVGGERDLDRESSRGIGLALRSSHHDLLQALHRREESKATAIEGGGLRSRSDSLASLATTLGSDRDRGRDGFKRAREVDEFELRDDLIAWTIPGGAQL
ncbi:hypothetical protein MMYC01_204923 [Madurella mycetomatis]|uniref:C2 NT-type domain-containing protein n=1 Tax=Madurella mycetomatis TaxID=100816 RepID=A0A175W468_9PEZI|nr:hypothetical protein MMYC01_204923 [Madurella mycetomatis]